jgi:anti-sigma B factor antagonist
MSIEISAREANGVVIIDVSGRITLGEGASVLRNAIRDLTSRGHNKILLDLDHVTYIDSVGLGMLVSGFTTVRSQGGQLKLLNLTRSVKDLLTITKLVTIFEVYDDEASAIRSFCAVSSAAPAQSY